MAAVVVGLDASATSRDALRFAVDTAAVTGSVLHAVHAWDAPVRAEVDLTGTTALAWYEDLDARRWPQQARMFAEPGAPAQALLAHAADADLLVVGASRHGPLRGRLGPVPARCLAESPSPVAVVCGPPSEGRGRPRVVVGCDLDDRTMSAVRWAAEQAVDREAVLEVVLAWQAVPHSLGDLVRPAYARSARAAVVTARAEEWLARTLSAHAGPVELTVEEGAPLDALLNRSRQADLLVLGAHHRPRSPHAACTGLGPQSALLLSCPVVVVPSGPRAVATLA